MLDSWVEEFIAVATYRSFSRAARELNISQPSLSQHIKQMEGELGFSLFIRSSRGVTLTTSGIHFFNKVTDIIQAFTGLIEECRALSEDSLEFLTVQMPPYRDAGGKAFLDYVCNVLNEDGTYRFRFVSEEEEHESYINSIFQGSVDLGIVYLYEGSLEGMQSFEKKGLVLHKLADVPMGLWVPSDHAYATEQRISIEQLAEVAISFPNNPHIPLKGAYCDLMNEFNLEPRFVEVHTSSRVGFFCNPHPDAIFFYPAGLEEDLLFSWRKNMVFVPLKEGLKFGAYAIALASSGLLPQDEAEDPKVQ